METLINKPEDIEFYYLTAEKLNCMQDCSVTIISRKSEIPQERKKYLKISVYLFFHPAKESITRYSLSVLFLL